MHKFSLLIYLFLFYLSLQECESIGIQGNLVR